jgi:hypothetical protein
MELLRITLLETVTLGRSTRGRQSGTAMEPERLADGGERRVLKSY